MTSSAILLSDDSRWCCENVVELASAAFDLDAQGVGSSPYLGDMANTGLLLPTAATTSQQTRYLVRLLGIQIPVGRSIIIRGLRQLATIREVRELVGGQMVPVELEITSPLWHFTDANISWHVKWHADNQFARRSDAAQVPGTDPDLIGLDTALLYQTLAPYAPPNGGVPPSRDVPYLGTWRDMRWPWTNTEWELNVFVPGPGLVVMYASVHQSNPATRPPSLGATDAGALRPEDRFIQEFTNAIYGRVGGAMTVELLPCCECSSSAVKFKEATP